MGLALPQDLGEQLAIAYSIPVLNCLCQPPPPDTEPPTDISQLGELPNFRPYYQRGGIRYNDGGDLDMVSAAGWMLPIPSNYYLRFQRGGGGPGDGGRGIGGTSSEGVADSYGGEGEGEGGEGGEGGGEGAGCGGG